MLFHHKFMDNSKLKEQYLKLIFFDFHTQQDNPNLN